MIVVGLSGSVGMGKSTTARLFAERGAWVWDADAAVHRLYAPGGAAVAAIRALAPAAVHDGAVDRSLLRSAILADPTLLGRVEAAVHPLVQADRAAFVAQAAAAGADMAVCDIPLLFETGQADAFDAVVVVTAPPEVQRARVMDRPGMTAATFDTILARQMPDAEKRARADFVIDASRGIADAGVQVDAIVAALKEGRDA